MPDDIRRIVATDCGSTTTKAILIELSDKGEYRLVARGEAPTTVERPFEDVTIGVLNSITELEEITETTVPEHFKVGRGKLIKDGKVWRRQKEGKQVDTGSSEFEGADIYVATSPA